MNKKVKKVLKLVITVVIIGLFVWFLVINPFLKFKDYEKTMTEAAERYFRHNENELPTGERVKSISLQDLYYKAYVKEDFYIPYTKSPCSLTESWVKVKRENGEYKYYTYLQCGVLSSTIDHKGPTITLNGESKVRVSKNEKFEDPGVKSVVDNNDGKIDEKEVTIKGKVDTSKTGTYEIRYIAFDSLNNRTEVKREVEVVEVLKSTIKEATKDKGYYSGENPNNYIYFSSMLFRIIGLDGENVKIVADSDIANVNYNGIDKWLDDYFYSHLSKESKKLIVENKYCNQQVDDNSLKIDKCSSYTSKRKVYIPSVIDVNKAQGSDGNFMRPLTMSWVANAKDKDMAYITRSYFVSGSNVDLEFMSFEKKYNFGVRPVITIKGDALITDGDGSRNNPYRLGDVKKAEAKEKVSDRYSGEYIKLSGMTWRIIEGESDGTTKIIATTALARGGQVILTNYEDDGAVSYNPKEKGNIGYYINNSLSEYIDSSYFTNKQIEVPIYKSVSSYGGEVNTKKYKVKFSAPNMYDMFSAADSNVYGSYWLINSSNDELVRNGISQVGVVMYGDMAITMDFGIRVVGYLKDGCTIVKGDGTYDNPYTIAK